MTRFRLLCKSCLEDARVTPLEHELAPDWFVCPVHGPQITGQFLWLETHRHLPL